MSGSATPSTNAVPPTTVRRRAMLTVLIGRMSSHRPPNDAGPVGLGLALADDGAVELCAVAVDEPEPSLAELDGPVAESFGAAWVQPASATTQATRTAAGRTTNDLRVWAATAQR
jgi:hypothetical protein